MAEIFALTKPLWEIALRGTVVYFTLILLVRRIPKRNAGNISPNDMLTLIVIGGMGTDAIMGGSTSAGDILLMIGVVYRFPSLRALMRERQTTLVEHGRLVRWNMRRELVTEEELMAVLRKQGIDDVASVRSACLEADGEISVIVGTREGG